MVEHPRRGQDSVTGHAARQAPISCLTALAAPLLVYSCARAAPNRIFHDRTTIRDTQRGIPAASASGPPSLRDRGIPADDATDPGGPASELAGRRRSD